MTTPQHSLQHSEAPETEPSLEIHIDTYSMTSPLDALFQTRAESTGAQVMRAIHMRAGNDITVYESEQEGLLGTHHPTTMPTGSIDIARRGFAKDTAEIRQILNGSHPKEIDSKAREIATSVTRILFSSVPTKKGFDQRYPGYEARFRRNDDRQIFRADWSLFAFEGHRSSMMRFLENTQETQAELVIEPFGLMANGYKAWKHGVAELREQYGERVKFSLDYAHLKEAHAITPIVTGNPGPELPIHVLDDLIVTEGFGPESIGAFEWNFKVDDAGSHSSPDESVVTRVVATEKAARAYGVGAQQSIPRIIEANRGSLIRPAERQAWARLVEAVASVHAD